MPAPRFITLALCCMSLLACEQANIAPDFMCLSKGITAGYLPLSTVLTHNHIYDAFYADYSDLKAFLHSHSYTGNALACRTALATLDIFKNEHIIAKNLEKSAYLSKALDIFRGHPNVGDVRQTGMVAAIEMVKENDRWYVISYRWHYPRKMQKRLDESNR